jgi:hypothetical protein
MDDHRRRHRAYGARPIEAPRHHVDEPFLPEEQRRRRDVERGNRNEVRIERRRP